MASRYRLQETRQRVQNLVEKLGYYEKEFVALSGQKGYDANKKYYANLISKAEKEMKALPIGHRYTGTFYIRVTYSFPAEYERIDGSVFMQEHLVSWNIEGEAGRNHGYQRVIYKSVKPELVEIKREEGTPVFQKQEEEIEV